MEDSTPHGNDVTVHDLLGVIRDAITASDRFSEVTAVGGYRCMTLFVAAANGLELTVSVTNPEVLG